MPFVQIGQDGFDQAIVWHRITEDPVLHPLVEGLNDFRRGEEIHVCNPEGLKFGALVPFQGTGSAPGSSDVEDGHERER